MNAPSFNGRIHVFVTLILLAGLLASVSVAPGTTAQSRPMSPEIDAVADLDVPGRLIVSGHGFTATGLVYIVLHDQWGAVLHETRWITASEISQQPPQDLALGEGFGFNTGGNIAESFDIVVGVVDIPDGSQNPALGAVTSMVTTMNGVDCTTPLLVRAFDRSTATWSNTVEVSLGCTG